MQGLIVLGRLSKEVPSQLSGHINLSPRCHRWNIVNSLVASFLVASGLTAVDINTIRSSSEIPSTIYTPDPSLGHVFHSPSIGSRSYTASWSCRHCSSFSLFLVNPVVLDLQEFFQPSRYPQCNSQPGPHPIKDAAERSFAQQPLLQRV